MWSEHIIDSSTERGGSLFIVRLVAPEGVARAVAGSHVTIGAQISHSWRYSTFSAAGVDQEGGIVTLVVRRTGTGGVSDLLSDTRSVGWRVQVHSTHDRLQVPTGRRLQMLVAGSGVGPALGLLSDGVIDAFDAVDLRFYGSTSDCLVVGDAFEHLLGDHEKVTVTQVDTSTAGRLHSDAVDDVLECFAPDSLFTCGPSGFMDLVVEGALRSGLSSDNLLAEVYTRSSSLPDAPPPDASGGRTHCVVDVFGARHEIAWPANESLLNALLRQGVDVPFSCRAGICSACQCRVVTGETSMQTDMGLSSEEKDAGLSLACQLFASSPEVSVQFV